MSGRDTSAVRVRSKMPLAQALEERLAAYALCAGAGMLALAQPADAQIDYTPVSVKLQCGPHIQGTYFCEQSAFLDLNHDGVNDFQLRNRWLLNTVAGTANYFSLGLEVRQPGAAVAFVNSFREALLQSGDSIGANQQWEPALHALMTQMLSFGSNSIPCFPSGGSWQTAKGGFLGLRFKIDGQTYYGWAEVSTELSAVHPCVIRAWLSGYAYNTVPNEPILAGQKTEIGAEALQPATLGVLALGSLGLDAWRNSHVGQ